MAVQAFDPADHNSGIALSGGNLIATKITTNAVEAIAFALNYVTSGKFYWETVVVCTAASQGASVGIGNLTTVTSAGAYLGSTTSSVGWYPDGTVWNNALHPTSWASWPTGSTLGVALDLTNGKLWGRVANSNWNNDVIGNQNPATNTGGYSIPAGVLAAPILPGVTLYNTTSPDTATVAFASASWAFTAPDQFVGFDDIGLLVSRARPVSFFR